MMEPAEGSAPSNMKVGLEFLDLGPSWQPYRKFMRTLHPLSQTVISAFDLGVMFSHHPM